MLSPNRGSKNGNPRVAVRCYYWFIAFSYFITTSCNSNQTDQAGTKQPDGGRRRYHTGADPITAGNTCFLKLSFTVKYLRKVSIKLLNPKI